VFAAREGDEIVLAARDGAERAPAAHTGSALLGAESHPSATVWVIARRDAAPAEIAAALAGENVRVHACRAEAAALRHAEQAPVPALVLVERDGAIERDLDVCRALRAARPLSGVPVVVIAGAQDGAAEMDAAFAAGASDYLSQPLKPTLLRARVRAWLMRA
jgi:PleD family two-component response regulator